MSLILKFGKIVRLFRYFYYYFIPDDMHKLLFIFHRKDYPTLCELLHKDLNTPEFKWKYLLMLYPDYITGLNLFKSCIYYELPIVKFAVENGFSVFNEFLPSDDFETVKYLLDYGAEPSGFFATSSMKIFNYLFSRYYGQSAVFEFMWCLFSNNVEIFKYGGIDERRYMEVLQDVTNIEMINYIISKVKPNPMEWSYLYRTNNMEFVKLAYDNGASHPDYCLSSNDMNIAIFGIDKGATDVEYALYSDNYDIVDFAIEAGARNFKNCYETKNVNIIVRIYKFCKVNMYYSINYLKLINKTKNIDIILFACKMLRRVNFKPNTEYMT